MLPAALLLCSAGLLVPQTIRHHTAPRALHPTACSAPPSGDTTMVVAMEALRAGKPDKAQRLMEQAHILYLESGEMTEES